MTAETSPSPQRPTRAPLVLFAFGDFARFTPAGLPVPATGKPIRVEIDRR